MSDASSSGTDKPDEQELAPADAAAEAPAAPAAEEPAKAAAEEPAAPAAEEGAAPAETPAAEAPAKPARKRRKAKTEATSPEGEQPAEKQPAAKKAPAVKKPAVRKKAADKQPTAASSPEEEKAAAPAPKPAPSRAAKPQRRRVVRARARYVRTSARKARMVCGHLRGKSVHEARAILAFTPREVARDWSKLLESAVANAESNHELLEDDLVVREAYADEGPTIKRFRPRAMGRATSIHKRTSHLTITLTARD